VAVEGILPPEKPETIIVPGTFLFDEGFFFSGGGPGR
jgi:hypothetical protein